MSSFDLTGKKIRNTYQRLTQISGSQLVDGTGSLVDNINVTSSFAITSSYAEYAVSASHEIIKEVSSSFADTASYVNPLDQDVQITGSLTVTGDGLTVTGSLTVSGSSTFTNIGPAVLSGSVDVSGSVGINTDTNEARFHVYNPTDGGSVRTAVFEHRWGANVLSQYARYGVIVKSEDLDTSLGITNQTYNSVLQGFQYTTPFSYKGIALNPLGGSVVVGRNLEGSTDDSAKFVIKGSGTTSATTTFLVQNSDGTTMFSIKDSGFVDINPTNDSGGSLRVRGDSTDNLLFVNANDNYVGIGGSTPNSTSLRAYIKGKGSTSATTALRVENSNATASLVVRDDGNVGIGTTNPIEKLEVVDVGSTNVTGTLKFKNDNNDYTHLYVQSNGYGFRLSAHAASKNGYIAGDGALNFAANKSFGGSYAWFGNGSLFKVMNPDDGYSTPFVLNHNNRVGIGTTSPTYKLNISGSDNENLLLVESPSNGSILVVTGSGNVGIGTTPTEGRLHVKGEGSNSATTAFLVQNASGADLLKVVNDGTLKLQGNTSIRFFGLEAFEGSNQDGGHIRIAENSFWNSTRINSPTIITENNDAPDASAMLQVDSTFIVRDDGNVGIGTTSPTTKLTISQSADSNGIEVIGFDDRSTDNIKMHINSSGTGEFLSSNGLRFNSVSGQVSFLYNSNLMMQIASTSVNIRDNIELAFGNDKDYSIGYNTADDTFRIVDGSNLSSNPRLTITSAGNVGIGTTSPYAKLHLSGTTGAESAIRQSRVGVRIWDSQIDSSGRLIWSHYASEGGTANQLFTLDDNGNVGIGTTSPTATLDIEDASGVTIDVNSSSGDGQFRFQDNAVTKWSMGRDNTQQNFVFSNSAGLSNDNVLVLTHTNGNVGIGTTSPSASLSIGDGTTSGVNVYLNKKDNNAAGYYVVNEGNAAGRTAFIRQTSGEDAEVGTSQTNSLSFLTNDTVRVHIDGGNNNGNVGIGTTSPTSLLHIKDNVNGRVHIEAGPSSGTSNSTARLIIEDNTSNAIQFLTPAGSFNSSIYFGDADNSSQGLINYNHSTDQLTLEGNSSFLIRSGGQNRLIVNSSGNVGIGTTTPSYKLDVVDAIRIDGTTNAHLFIDRSATNRQAHIEFKTANSLDWSMGSVDTGDFSGAVGDEFFIGTSVSTPNFLITPSGKVGIGTTSPSSTLQVKGSGTTSATSALKIENSTPTTIFDLKDNGQFSVGPSNDSISIASNGRVTIAASAPDLSIGGGNYLDFPGGAGTIDGVRTINRTGEIRINATQGVRFGSTANSAGTRVSIVGDNNTTPFGIQQTPGGTTNNILATFISGSGDVVMGITADGGFTATDSTLVKRYTFEHGYVPSPADGMGIGLDLKTENASGTVVSVGHIDAVQDDISEDESSLRFSVGEGTPTEVMRLQSTGNVGIGTTSPDASAILDIASTSKGVLFPRMTETQRTAISSPATGLIVYQTDATEGLYIYKSTGWVQII